MIAAPPMGIALTAAVLQVGVPSGFFSALRKSEKSAECQVRVRLQEAYAGRDEP